MTEAQNQFEKTRLVFIRHQQVAQYFTEELGNGIGLDMVLIRGGTFLAGMTVLNDVPNGQFLMGSPEDEPDRFDNEGPQREVSVPTFFMGKFPITQQQWRMVAETYPSVARELNPDPSYFKGDNHPVEQVSWFEAIEFCARLSQHTGRDYRLPTEAEWEYACRAGTTTPFHFGETITPELANYDGSTSYGRGPTGIFRRETTEVGSLNNPNDFGLYDMHGNVWEWCQDHWHPNYDGHPTDGSAWIMPRTVRNSNHPRILRGGAWGDDPKYCRSACRFKTTPDSHNRGDGFRVACSAQRSLQG